VSDESFSYHEGNPVCDDALTVSVRIENDCIAAIGFQ
jgi:NifU-like protein involved in Fe-S cluster formation